ncbi:MAG: hypothetical protein LLF76_02450 [Planctomycetaceae bacterium]|nr:hypothetical protein [Planctomycetaceae bacterium]
MIESTLDGEVLAAAGPFDAEDLPDLDNCQCTARINIWIKRAIAENKLRRFKPQTAGLDPIVNWGR